MPPIYFNEDNHHFYGNHPPEDMTPEGLARYVDVYADTGAVRGILFCVNVQRALFDSAVWERFRDIDDPDPYVANLRRLSERGVDQFEVWLARAAARGLEPWLSMRMNDSHGLKEAAQNLAEPWHHKWPSRFWRARPDLRRAPYRSERSWEGSFNYLLPEVRAHHLALVAELFDRYDPFGLELDWMRWGMMVPPGFEREAHGVLTDFVGAVRELADRAEQRRGHRIRLAHRLPAGPESCLNFGFDVIAWGRRGWVDMATLSAFCGHGSHDPALALWRALLPPGTVLNVVADTVTRPYPAPEKSVLSDEVLYGAAAAAYALGADHLYLFNENYRETENREQLRNVLRNLADSERLAQVPRLFPVTYTPAVIPGESNRNTLPVRLRQEGMGFDLARMEDNITLRLPAGRVASTDACYLRIGFSADTEALPGLSARVNTTPVAEADWPAADRFRPGRRCYTGYPFLPPEVAFVKTWRVPAAVLHATWNAVELMAPPVAGSVVWADLLCLPG